MKKFLKVAGIVLLSIVMLTVLFLFGIKIWNHVAMSGEKELLQNHPGVSVEVDGHNMNIYTEGQGDHTLVFMSGWKVPSPIYEYKPLYSKLSDEYRCVVIEKFGYGFADEFDGSRDFDTLVRQDREALKMAGIEGAPLTEAQRIVDTLEAALRDAYAAADTVEFDGKYLRRDIGQRALKAAAG